MKIRLILSLCITALLYAGEAMSSTEVPRRIISVNSECLHAIRAAIYEVDKRGFSIGKGNVEVFESSKSFIVVFGASDPPVPGERGNLSGTPILEIELKKASYEVLRANYLR